jgi:hypothetical protein
MTRKDIEERCHQLEKESKGIYARMSGTYSDNEYAWRRIREIQNELEAMGEAVKRLKADGLW